LCGEEDHVVVVCFDREARALSSTYLLPKLWKRFVDDTSVVWSHGHDELDLFFHYLNEQSSAIKFTMEKEVNGCLPFLDVLISKNNDGSFSHQVFQKKTHTNQYLHASSHHFAAQKLGVLNTLDTHALRISDEKNLAKEKAHLLDVFIKIGYSRHLVQKSFLKAWKEPSVHKDLKDRILGVHLPYIQGTTDRIVRILKKHNIPLTFRPLNTIHSSLRSVKDPVDPKDMKGVYVIPCSYGAPYIGETGRSINHRISEHSTDLKHGRAKSSALAKHAEKTKHHVCIEEA